VFFAGHYLAGRNPKSPATALPVRQHVPDELRACRDRWLYLTIVSGTTFFKVIN
jgi:hypothetical protein